MSRVLAIDYGEKRVGIAVSDPLCILANPVACLANDPNLVPTLQSYVTDYALSKIILGLPLKLDGTDTAKTVEVRTFGQQLETQVDVPIELRDERFTTVAVNRTLDLTSLSEKKKRVNRDVMAACFLLQGYLDSLT